MMILHWFLFIRYFQGRLNTICNSPKTDVLLSWKQRQDRGPLQALSSFWSWASDTRLHKPHSTHSCLKCTEAHWPRWETGLLLTHSHNFSLLFVCFAHTAAIWGSLRKMKKKQKNPPLSQRSLSRSITQSQRNGEAWRAWLQHSEVEILHSVLFLK